jgi:hypothetical protein
MTTALGRIDLRTILPSDFAGELEAIVRRLEIILGDRITDAPHGPGEPDGHSGIARRGSLDQILATSWSLLDVAPEEFLRRLRDRELSYLERSVRATRGEEQATVLFDAGPALLGAPRIVALAALLALARRASRAHVRLSWGLLQEPRALRDASDPKTIEVFLEARRPRPATESDLRAWSQVPGALWLVGGPRSPQTEGARRIVIDEGCEIDRIDVAYLAPGVERRTVVDRPAEKPALAALRGPGATPSVAAGSAFVVAPCGQKFFERRDDGALLTYDCRRSSRGPRRPKVYQPSGGGIVVAVGQRRPRTRTRVLVERGDELLLVDLARNDRESSSEVRIETDARFGPSAPLAPFATLRDRAVFFATPDGRTFRLCWRGLDELSTRIRIVRIEPIGALAITDEVVPRLVRFAATDDGDLTSEVLAQFPTSFDWLHVGSIERPLVCAYGLGQRVVILATQRPDIPRVVETEIPAGDRPEVDRLDLDLPQGVSFIGIVEGPTRRHVLLDRTRGVIALRAVDGNETLLGPFSGEIEGAFLLSTWGPLVAVCPRVFHVLEHTGKHRALFARGTS